MRPQDALEYGIIDEIIQPDANKKQKAVEYWVKSGRAESEGRLEQWQEYLSLQEEYALKDSFKKVVGQVREYCYISIGTIQPTQKFNHHIMNVLFNMRNLWPLFGAYVSFIVFFRSSEKVIGRLARTFLAIQTRSSRTLSSSKRSFLRRWLSRVQMERIRYEKFEMFVHI